jgi:MarR family transcriptional regulator for hemolysin
MQDKCLPHGVIIRLIKLAHKLEDAAERLFFSPHGLTMPTGRILMILGRLGRATPSELINIVECTKSNLSQRLATLEKAGLIAHQKPQKDSDQRHTTIILTEKGRLQAEKLMHVFDNKIKELEDSIPQKDWDGALNVIQAIHQKIDSTSPTSQTN